MEKAASGRVRLSYLAPRIDIYELENYRLLANSPLSGGHDDGVDDGIITGAKGFNNTITDVWGLSWDEDFMWREESSWDEILEAE